MNLLRLLKVLLRGLRPISRSLAQISTDIHLLARIQEARAQAELDIVLAPENAKPAHTPEFATEISYDVAEPKVDPQTGKAVVEDAAEFNDYTDWGGIFKGKR